MHIIIILIVSLFFSFSCTKKTTKKEGTATGSGTASGTTISKVVETPVDGGTIVIASASDIASLNPLTYLNAQEGNVLRQMFMYLVNYDSTLNIIPGLAEKYSFSPDFLKLTYNIRKGVKWSDGTPVTASDVEYSINMYKHPDINYRWASDLELIDSVKVVNDSTVEITFKEVYVDEISNSGTLLIVPKHILEKVPPKDMKDHPFKYQPVGCGPFKLEKWDRGQQWSLIPNEHYYKRNIGGQTTRLPHLDRVIYRVMPEETSRLTGIKTGEVDVVEEISPQFYTELKNNPLLNVLLLPDRGYSFVCLMLDNPLFQSKKVRQALAMALNKQEIIDRYLFGLGEECKSPFMRSIWAYNDKIVPFPYNPEKAKAILAEEGWKDTNGDGILDKGNLKFSFTLKYNNTDKIAAGVSVYIQEQYKKLGIEVKTQPMERNTHIQDLQTKNFEAAMSSWKLPFYINPKGQWHSSFADKPRSANSTKYKNAVIDSLIEAGKLTMDIKKSKAIWDKFQEIIYDDQPYLFLFNRRNVYAVNKRLHGVKGDVRGLYNMEEWWVSK